MKTNRNKLPWNLLAVVVLLAAVHTYWGYADAHRLFHQNFMISSSVYCIAEAAARGDTNGVMKVLSQVWNDTSDSYSGVLAACDKNREQIVSLQTTTNMVSEQDAER